MNTITVTINKPLYDNYVNIRDTYLKKALQQHAYLRIIIPQGEAVVDPREWVATGKRVEQVFKIPGKPMVLYGNFVPLKNYTHEEKKQKPSLQLSLL